MDTPKILVRNIILICASILGLVILASCLLRVITHHGSRLETPDLVGLTVPEAEQVARYSHMRVEVVDSTYVKAVQRGGVFMQDPAAGAYAKKGRRIRLVVNATVPRKVSMPNVEDCPVRQAVSDLTSKGFVIGHLYYEAGDDDLVICQMIGQKRVKPHSQVESGSEINLRVGFDGNHPSTSVPNVMGKHSTQARKEINERSLNVRRLSYDSSVRSYADTVNAVVYRQSPEPTVGQVNKGSEITLYLSVDPAKISK